MELGSEGRGFAYLQIEEKICLSFSIGSSFYLVKQENISLTSLSDILFEYVIINDRLYMAEVTQLYIIGTVRVVSSRFNLQSFMGSYQSNIQIRGMQTQKSFFEKILQLTIIAGFTFAAYTILGLQGFVAIAVSFSSLSILLYLKWRRFRQRGLIASLRQKLRIVLLQRSILDIFRDLVYFPYVTKIIGAAITIATTKPHPDRIPQILQTLPSQVCQVATKKGLLSLAPSAVQSLILPQLNKELLPAHYGHNQSQWDRIQEYHKGEQLVHEQTFEKRVIVFLDGKFGWLSVLMMLGAVLAGAHHMNPKKFKRMIVQNSTFCCLVLSLIAVVIKIRRHYHKNKRINASQTIKKIAQE